MVWKGLLYAPSCAYTLKSNDLANHLVHLVLLMRPAYRPPIRQDSSHKANNLFL